MTDVYNIDDCTTKEKIQERIAYFENIDPKYGFNNRELRDARLMELRSRLANLQDE